MPTLPIAIIGSGPAGLMAAETLSLAGEKVVLFDRMASPARKFLMAGRGGLNLTHSESWDTFKTRYAPLPLLLDRALDDFNATHLRDWCQTLGIDTFQGSSGRIFPVHMKASPLLRAWLKRLEKLGVEMNTRHTWQGWADDGTLLFDHAGTPVTFSTKATLITTGGRSWPKLGSDGSALDILMSQGIETNPTSPSNAGIAISWSDYLIKKYQGSPLKAMAFTIGGTRTRGEAVLTHYGLEGGAIYALSQALRQALQTPTRKSIDLELDFTPDLTRTALIERLHGTKAKDSLSNKLRKATRLPAAQIALLRESQGGPLVGAPESLAERIKSARYTIQGTQGFEKAISTAGGVSFDALDDHFMLKAKPGVFVAGEMLDWDAPTGGYLLQATFATGIAAAKGCLAWLQEKT